MRKFGLFLACGVMVLMSVAWVEGQQGEKKKAGGGGFQFGTGGIFGQRQSPLSLLERSDVKKELEVGEDQLEKLPAEVMVAISKVLSAKQFNRFKQLELQKQENNAFKDESIQKALSLTDEQKKSVTSLVADSNKELAELRKGGFGGGGFGKGGNNEKVDTIKKETKEKIYTVLTKDQRKAWREMIGEEFKFENLGFGGGGFGGFGKKGADTKKKDDKDK